MNDIDTITDSLPSHKYSTTRLFSVRTKMGQITKDTYRPEYQSGIKRAEYTELEQEGIIEIYNNIDCIKERYRTQIDENLEHDQITIFNRCLSFWVDGMSKRNAPEIMGLKKDILCYLMTKYNTLSESKIYCDEKVSTYQSAGIEYETLDFIFKLNRQFIDEALSTIVSNVDDEFPLNNDDLMLHRGLNVSSKNPKDFANSTYYEKNFLSSYSLSIHIAEKFAVTNFGTIIIVSANLKHFEDRILAASLFSKSLEKSQLEFLVIPHWCTLECKLDTRCDGIYEFVLDTPEGYRGLN